MTRLRFAAKSGSRGKPAGEVEANGDVYVFNDMGRRFIGRVDEAGRVWNAAEASVGSVAPDRQVYDTQGTVVGQVTPTGEVRVGEGIAGYIEGNDLCRGGAALLLLLKAVPIAPPPPPVPRPAPAATASPSPVLPPGGWALLGSVILLAAIPATIGISLNRKTTSLTSVGMLSAATGERTESGESGENAASGSMGAEREDSAEAEIADRMRRSGEAFARQDMDGLLAYTTDDWQFVAEDGRVDTLADSRAFYAGLFQRRATVSLAERTARIDKRIREVLVTGTDARTLSVEVTVKRGDGATHRFVQTEEWVRTLGGWCCRRERRSVAPSVRKVGPTSNGDMAAVERLSGSLRTRALTGSDLASFSARQLDLLRNEPFARYGLKFTRRPELAAYFTRQGWYTPRTTDDSAVYARLSATEKRNVIFIREYQAARGMITRAR